MIVTPDGINLFLLGKHSLARLCSFDMLVYEGNASNPAFKEAGGQNELFR
jgi:hypothetical protein